VLFQVYFNNVMWGVLLAVQAFIPVGHCRSQAILYLLSSDAYNGLFR